MNNHRLDLNLFKVFDVIYTTGSLTKAAEVLCITQPAVSHALNKLRVLLDDPLFQRQGNLMVPTARAHNIIGDAREALKLLNNTLLDEHCFKPDSAEHHFRFCMSDLLEISLLPRLIALIQDKAPHIQISNKPLDAEVAIREMQLGRLDFLLHTGRLNNTSLNHFKIAEDRMVLIARKQHPLLVDGNGSANRLDEELFCQLRHIDISVLPNLTEQLAEHLAKKQLQRTVSVNSHHLMSVPATVTRSNLVACVPFHFSKHFELDVFEIPFNLPKLEYHIYWSRASEGHAAMTWMLQQMKTLASQFIQK